MKKVLILFSLCLAVLHLSAQDKAERPSPPKTATATVNGGEVTINYSSPAVKGRTVWGDLVPYDKLWRAGANEATTLTTEKEVTIKGQTLPPGKYALFAIPGENEWTIVLNSVWDQWGGYNYDRTKDVLRFTVAPRETEQSAERLTYTISEDGMVVLAWDKLEVPFKLE